MDSFNLEIAIQKVNAAIDELSALIQTELANRKADISIITDYQKVNKEIEDAKEIDLGKLQNLLSKQSELKKKVQGIQSIENKVNLSPEKIDILQNKLLELKNSYQNLEKSEQDIQARVESSMAGDPVIPPGIVHILEQSIQELSGFQDSRSINVFNIRDAVVLIIERTVKAMLIIQQKSQNDKLNQQVEMFCTTLNQMIEVIRYALDPSNQKEILDLIKICIANISYVRDLTITSIQSRNTHRFGSERT